MAGVNARFESCVLAALHRNVRVFVTVFCFGKPPADG